MRKRAAFMVLIVACMLMAACSRFAHHAAKSYTTVVADSNHDAEKARADCERAAELFDKGKLDKAEAALQDALIADVSFAPAHNNLGRIYYEQGRLYLAAWEFEYARRLAPECADATNNLGLVYEAAEQLPRAIEQFRLAHAMDRANPEYAGNLARALVRSGEDSAEVAGLLQDLVFHDTRPDWVAWARDQLNLHMSAQAIPSSATTADPPVPEPLPPPRPANGQPLSIHLDDLPLQSPAVPPPQRQ